MSFSGSSQKDLFAINTNGILVRVGNGDYESRTISGTTNQVNITNPVNGNMVISLPQNIHSGATPTFASITTSGNGTIGGNLTVTGDLAVSGNSFIVEAQTIQVADNLILVNKNEVGSGVTNGEAGIEVERGSSTNFKFVFEETRGKFVVGTAGSTQIVATREDSPISGGFAKYNAAQNRFDTVSASTLLSDISAVPTSRTISTGTGLSGGGDLTANRTLSLANTTVSNGSYGSATQVGTFTVDAQGRLTAAGNTTITPAWSSITSKPTTLSGYGITDAMPLSGGNFTGTIKIVSNAPQLIFDESDQTNSAGVFRIITNGDAFSINRNTAVARDFSTNTTPFSISNTDAVTFSSTASATRFISNIATGTSPFTVTSTTRVDNLNVQYLNGSQATQFCRSDNTVDWNGSSAGLFRIQQAAAVGTNTSNVNTLQIFQGTASNDAFMTFHISGDYAVHFGLDNVTNDLFVGGYTMGAVKNKVWHAGNDGASSGLDADLLDGQQGSYYQNASNLSSGTVPTARLGSGTADNTTYLRGDGTWATISGGGGGLTISNDTSQATDHYVLFASTTSGTITSAEVSNTKLLFNPGNGTLLATAFSGNGSQLSNLNATLISSGMVGTARLGSGTANNTTFLRGDNTWAAPSISVSDDTTQNAVHYIPFLSTTSGTVTGVEVSSTKLRFNPSTGIVTANGFSGSGADLVSLNASNLTTGTVARERLGSGGPNSDNFLRGDGTWSALPSAVNIRALTTDYTYNLLMVQSASTADDDPVTDVHVGPGWNETTGTIDPAGLGTGTADSTTFLRGDGTWATVSGGGGGSGLVWVYSIPDATTVSSVEVNFNDYGTGVYTIQFENVEGSGNLGLAMEFCEDNYWYDNGYNYESTGRIMASIEPLLFTGGYNQSFIKLNPDDSNGDFDDYPISGTVEFKASSAANKHGQIPCSWELLHKSTVRTTGFGGNEQFWSGADVHKVRFTNHRTPGVLSKGTFRLYKKPDTM